MPAAWNGDCQFWSKRDHLYVVSYLRVKRHFGYEPNEPELINDQFQAAVCQCYQINLARYRLVG